MLWIHSSLSCWIFGLMKVCFLSAQTNTFFFISSQPPPPHFFTLCSLFSFISTVFMLQPGHRVSKPIKSHMKVKYANANVNNFKMFAGRIKTQQFLWRRKKRLINPHSQAYPPPAFFFRGFYSAIFSHTGRLETFLALISSLSLSSPGFLPAHITAHVWLQRPCSCKVTFVTLCPSIGVASVVTTELLIRVIWAVTTHHRSLFREFAGE